MEENKSEEIRVPRLFSLKQFSEQHNAFTVPSLRWIRYNQRHNGFADAFVNVGSRVLIDEQRFFSAIDRLNTPPAGE